MAFTMYIQCLWLSLCTYGAYGFHYVHTVLVTFTMYIRCLWPSLRRPMYIRCLWLSGRLLALGTHYAGYMCVYVWVCVWKALAGPAFIPRVGQDHTYSVYIHNIFGRGITKYTVLYGAYIQYWPILWLCNILDRAFSEHACVWCCLFCSWEFGPLLLFFSRAFLVWFQACSKLPLRCPPEACIAM